MKSEIRDRVWWSDVDKMDVMHYAKYLRFTERAEAEFFRTAGFTYDDLHRRFGIWLARVNLDVRYICSARLDDELLCTVELVKLGGSSLHFSFGIKRADGVLLAEVTLVLACLDAATMKAVRIPVALREALSIAA